MGGRQIIDGGFLNACGGPLRCRGSNSIHDEREELNLDAQQRRQVSTGLQKADETVDLRLRATYSWLLAPIQSDPLGAIELQDSRISRDDNFYDRAARKLRNDGLLIYECSPDILRMELDRYVWSDERGWVVGVKQLWEYLVVSPINSWGKDFRSLPNAPLVIKDTARSRHLSRIQPYSQLRDSGAPTA